LDCDEVIVKPNQTVSLEQFPPFGRLSISNQTGVAWIYDDFAFYSLREGYTTWSRFPNFPIQTATKIIAIKPDGKLYLLPRRFLHWDRKKYESNQPDGFPVLPTKEKKES
jgi:hypothetical protein